MPLNGGVMPRQRNLVAYHNAHYMALVEKVMAEGKTLFPCERRQAVTIQGEFYAWRRICEANPEEAAGYGVRAEVLRNVALRATDEGLVAMPESEMLAPSILGAVLGPVGQRGKEPGSGAKLAAEALSRLRGSLGEAS